MLGLAIELRNSITIDTLPAYIKYLNASVQDLGRCIEAVDRSNTLTYSVYDLLKNAALASIQYDAAVKTTAKTKHGEYSASDLAMVHRDAVVIVKRFVSIGKNDDSAGIFEEFLRSP